MFKESDKEKLMELVLAEMNYPTIDLNSVFNEHQSLIDIRSTLQFEIERCIRDSQKELLKSLINALYTHENFEEDVGLT